MSRHRYVATPSRVLLGLFGGAVAAALAWTTVILALALADHSDVGTYSALVFGLAVFVVYAVGLASLGGPLWIILHELGLRGPLAATMFGAVLSFGTTLLMLPLYSGSTPNPWPSLALAATLIGATVGWVIWCVAYRRTPA